MLSSYTPIGLDPGWLGQPKTRPTGGMPQFGGGTATPAGQYSRPGYVGAGQGSYSNFGGINDPTLAPGSYGSYGGGPVSGVGGLPPGAIRPSVQWAGGRLPNFMASAGWRVVRGPDGQEYWAPPGAQTQEQQPRYNAY